MKANDLRGKFLDSKNVAEEKEGMTLKQAVKRLMGAASSVAAKQSFLRLNCDDLAPKTTQEVVDHFESEGFGVVAEKDESVLRRVWFTLDWTNPPEPVEKKPNTKPIKREAPKA